EPANPLKTPEHIAPVRYFTPFYAILRAVPSFAGTQVWGVIAMGISIVTFFLLPWLDKSNAKSHRYKGPLFKISLAIFVVTFAILGYLGVVSATADRTLVAQMLTLIYFGFFFLMPTYTRESSDKTTMTSIYFLVMAIATIATLYYWWILDGGAEGSMLVKLIVTAIAAGHFVIFGIKPWFKPEQSKPVPERVTE
ncbi:MAG: hypothetical protein P8Z31_12680, partial [Gammaproteobacteria bacterium]